MEIAGVCRHLGEGGGAGQKRGFRRKLAIPEARVAAVWTAPAACLWAAGRSPMQGYAGLSSDPPFFKCRAVGTGAGVAQEKAWEEPKGQMGNTGYSELTFSIALDVAKRGFFLQFQLGIQRIRPGFE